MNENNFNVSKVKNDREYIAQLVRRADEFNDYQNQYYNNQISSETLTSKVTQPFFKSLELSKRRLDDNGITMRTEVYPEKKRLISGLWQKGMKEPEIGEEGNLITAKVEKKVVAKHSFYRNGREVYSYKDNEISTVELLKVKGDGKYAACPNCGNVALISTYIDGCDYCHSKFAVEDFETKISGYSLKEDFIKKAKSTYLKSLRKVVLATIIAAIVLIASIMVLITAVSGTAGRQRADKIFSGSYDIYPALAIGIFWFLFILLIVYWLYSNFRGIHFTRANAVKRIMPEFSASDFCQNLEYKLKSIHMADRASDVEAFAGISLDNVVKRNEGTVDCSLVRVRFRSAREGLYGYEIGLSCKLRLIVLKNGRLKRRYEKLRLKMSLDKSVSMQRIGGIRAYICPDCGGNIDLLDGGKCEYCGHKIAYSKYDWIIRDYSCGIMKISDYGKIRLGIVLLYMLVLGVIFTKQDNEESIKSLYNVIDYMRTADEPLEDMYGEIIKPDIDTSKLDIVEGTFDVFATTYSYEDIDGVYEAQRYYDVLSNHKEYIFYDRAENYFVFYYATVFYDRESYVRIYVEYDEDTVDVELNMADDIGE